MLTQGPNKIKWKKQEWNWKNETDSTKQFNPKKCKTVSFESKKKMQDCINWIQEKNTRLYYWKSENAREISGNLILWVGWEHCLINLLINWLFNWLID